MAKDVHVKIEFLTEILGMSPSDPDIYSNFIASRADCDVEDELEGLTTEATGYTVFPRDDDGNPCFFDYQVRGFFKDSCGLLSRVAGVDEATGKRSKKKATTLSGRLSCYKKVIDGNIFVTPRKIPIHTDSAITLCERPLRAMTAQGERIALAASEQIAEGAWMEFTVHLLNDNDLDLLMEWLAYGEYHGLGQWRNSGKGSFRVVECVVTDCTNSLIPKFEVRYA